MRASVYDECRVQMVSDHRVTKDHRGTPRCGHDSQRRSSPPWFFQCVLACCCSFQLLAHPARPTRSIASLWRDQRIGLYMILSSSGESIWIVPLFLNWTRLARVGSAAALDRLRSRSAIHWNTGEALNASPYAGNIRFSSHRLNQAGKRYANSIS
jgi:hypothetical protein